MRAVASLTRAATDVVSCNFASFIWEGGLEKKENNKSSQRKEKSNMIPWNQKKKKTWKKPREKRETKKNVKLILGWYGGKSAGQRPRKVPVEPNADVGRRTECAAVPETRPEDVSAIE